MVARGGSVYTAGGVAGRLPRQRWAGDMDAFVRKYEPQGDEVWTRQFGTPGADQARAVGGNRNVFVAGSTEGALPGQAAAGGTDAFVRKYNPQGRALWTRQFGTDARDAISGVDADRGGSIYVAGSTEGALPGQAPAGGTDAFVRKYDGNGGELWSRQFGTDSRDMAFAVAEDGSGNVYVVGTTFGVFPGETTQGPAAGDAFVRKYDSQGNELWTRQFGALGFPSVEDQALGVAIAGDRNVYMVGYTTGTFPGQAKPGGRDGFLRKYDPQGNELWTREFGTPAFDFGFGVGTEPSGGVYAVADVGLTPAPGGHSDALVAKYDSGGSALWTNRFGTNARDSVRGIDPDRQGNVYVAGSTEGALRGRSAGGADAFLAKLGPRR